MAPERRDDDLRMARLRQANAWVSAGIIVLLLVHAVAGGYQMAGVLAGGNQVLTTLAWILVGLICIHAAIGTILTVRGLRSSRGERFYGRENAGYVVRRVSGFAILVFAACHLAIFYGNYETGSYRLNLFEGPQLVLSICLVASIAVHLLCNIKPLFISLGLSGRPRRRDVVVILAVVLVFAVAMFALYYYRWNIGWEWNIQLGSSWEQTTWVR